MNVKLVNKIITEAVEEFNKEEDLRYGQCIFNAAFNNCDLDTQEIVNMGIDCFYDDGNVEAFIQYIGENF